MKQSWKRVLMLLPAAVLIFSLTACEDDPTEPSLTDFEVVRLALVDWLAGSPASTIAPSVVYDDVVGPNSYYILSVRAESVYDLGHIEGAARHNWNDIHNATGLPTDQKIVLYCYTGHTGGIATAALGVMGYDTDNLKWGMMNWTDDATVLGTSFWTAEDALGGTLETTVNPIGTTTYDYPDLEVSTSDDSDVIVKAAIDRYLGGAAGSALITSAQAVFDNLNDGNSANDPIIISIRSADHYGTLGHVPGAINITKTDLTDLTVLNKLDPSRDIVVYCYTGHSQAQALTILNILGYNAKMMKFGMMGWSTDGNPASALFTGSPGYPTVATGGN